MSATTIRKRIPLVSLVADRGNPRLPHVADSHRAALLQVIRVQGAKVVALVRDIVAMGGLNPGESLWVVEDPDQPGTYIVVEGNRRYAALRLLQEPGLGEAAGLDTEDRRGLMRAIGSFVVPPEVECTVFPSREDALPWIERKHTGERDGAGTVRWGTVQRARFEATQQGFKSPGLEILDFVLDHRADLDTGDRLRMEERFSLTNLERILDDKGAQKRLGVGVRQGRLVTSLYGARLHRTAGRLVDDVAHTLKVGDIDDGELIRGYLDTFLPRYVPEDAPRREPRLLSEVTADEKEPEPTLAPPTTAPTAQSAPTPSPAVARPEVVAPTPALAPAREGQPDPQAAPQPPAAPDAPPSPPGAGTRPARGKTRQTMAPPSNRVFRSNLKIFVKHRRVEAIFVELKKIDAGTFPNAAAALKRIMLDLSADALIEKVPALLPQKNGQPDRTLYKRVESIANRLLADQRLDNPTHEAVMRAATQKFSEASVRGMNLNVHNLTVMPTAQEVQATWAVFEPFYQALWGWYAELD